MLHGRAPAAHLRVRRAAAVRRAAGRSPCCPARPSRSRPASRACAEAGVPWVARGSGSGLSGGALPVDGRRADRHVAACGACSRSTSPNQRVCVEPGVTNIAVSSAVAPDFFYPPDPSSQIVCSIGGNVAENSGGAHCFKYGFTTNYVCGLEVVLPDGELIDARRARARRAGLRPARRVRRLRGHARDRHEDVAARDAGARDGQDARRLLRLDPRARARRSRRSSQSGVVPGAIEMMDKLAIEASEQMAHAGYPVGRGAALLVELDGAERECETRFEEVVARVRALRLRRRARGRATRPSASCSGRRARPRSRRWAASRRTTSSRTA